MEISQIGFLCKSVWYLTFWNKTHWQKLLKVPILRYADKNGFGLAPKIKVAVYEQYSTLFHSLIHAIHYGNDSTFQLFTLNFGDEQFL